MPQIDLSPMLPSQNPKDISAMVPVKSSAPVMIGGSAGSAAG